LEYELLVIVGLSSSLCFVLGSWFSPLVKTLKKECQYWRGIAGKQKSELNQEKKDNNPLENILGDSPLAKIAKPFVEKYLNNPDEIQKLLDNFTKKGKDSTAASEWR